MNTCKAAWHMINTVSFVIAVTGDILGDRVVLLESYKPLSFEFQLCHLGPEEASCLAQPVCVAAKGRLTKPGRCQRS